MSLLWESEIDEYGKQISHRRKYELSPSLYTTVDELGDKISSYTGRQRVAESIYGKQLDAIAIELNRELKNLDRSNRELQERIKKFSNSINGAKYEVELRNLSATYHKTKLDFLKAKADLITKKDKSYKEDYKLAMELTGGGQLKQDGSIGSVNSFMTSLINSNDTMPRFNYNTGLNDTTLERTGMVNMSDVAPMKVPESILGKTVHVSDSEYLDKLNTPTESATPESSTNVTEYTETTVHTTTTQTTPPNPEPLQPSLNKPEFNESSIDPEGEGLNDFIDTNGPSPDGEIMLLAYKYKEDPNTIIFFKYNRQENIGYLIYVDTKNNVEIPKLPTLPLAYIYPWIIDAENNIVSTRIGDDYPIMYTDDPIPIEIKQEYEALVSARENLMNDEE